MRRSVNHKKTGVVFGVAAARALASAFGVAAAALAGCASLTNDMGVGQDVSAVRKQREQKAVAEFEARRDAAQYHGAVSRLRSGDVANARPMLETIVARNADYLPARLLLAEILLESNQPEAALEHVQYVVERAPKEAAPRHVEGLVYEALGRADEALASFQQATDLDPENEVYRLSFQTAAQQAAGERAAAASPSPQDVAATLAAAAAALERDDPEESIRLLSPALEYAPGDARLWRALGASHYRRGDYGRAQVVLTKAVSLDTSDPLSYFLLGATLRRLGQPAEAERHLAAAAELDPRYATRR